jgi:hypothetical protein
MDLEDDEGDEEYEEEEEVLIDNPRYDLENLSLTRGYPRLKRPVQSFAIPHAQRLASKTTEVVLSANQ